MKIIITFIPCTTNVPVTQIREIKLDHNKCPCPRPTIRNACAANLLTHDGPIRTGESSRLTISIINEQNISLYTC